MTIPFYAIFNKNGFDRAVKGDAFQLKSHERACRIEIEIDDDAFDSPPVPVVRISVPKEALTRTFVGTAVSPEVEAGG